MTIILFFAVLFVLILVHEWGHFIVAKKTGMRVDEFGIGFPPKLFGWKKGETEYTLNALPIGGFVKIFGENYEDGESESGAVDHSRSFGARPKWGQALVLVAGVAMNILFAWFLFVVALMVGVPELADENNPNADAALRVVSVVPDSPAEQAGIPVGATITAVSAGEDTLSLPTPSNFQSFVVENAAETIVVEYEKGGSVTTADLVTETGLVADEASRPAVGVTLSYTQLAKEPLHRAIILGAQSTFDSLVAITIGLSGLLYETVVGTADYSQVAGPVGIAGLVGDAAEFGITSLILFTAMISLNLAVINMVPFPALDGGRLVFVAVEAITGRDVPAVWAMRLNLLGFALLMVLMILVTYGDIAKMM